MSSLLIDASSSWFDYLLIFEYFTFKSMLLILTKRSLFVFAYSFLLNISCIISMLKLLSVKYSVILFNLGSYMSKFSLIPSPNFYAVSIDFLANVLIRLNFIWHRAFDIFVFLIMEKLELIKFYKSSKMEESIELAYNFLILKDEINLLIIHKISV